MAWPLPDIAAPNSSRIREIARRLDELYGARVWRSSGAAIDELIATILSQHTSDVNTERAFASLKAQFPDWQAVIDAPTDDVAVVIRSGGLANLKAPRIQAALASILARYGSFELGHLATRTVSEARAELQELRGVGPKTASCVLLFSLGMPAMPVDTHVHRVSRRLGLIDATTSADQSHAILEQLLGENRDDVYAFHLNMIAHGRSVCVARRPRCGRCGLAECCNYYVSGRDK